MGAETRGGTWPCRVRHLVISLGVALAGYGVFVLVLLGAVACLVGGLPLFVKAVELNRRLADFQRARVGVEPGSPYPPMPDGTLAKVLTILGTPATARDLLWVALPGQLFLAVIGALLWLSGVQGVLTAGLWAIGQFPDAEYLGMPITGPGSALLATLAAALALFLGLRAPGPAVELERRYCRWLLAPTQKAQLAARVERLTRTRSEAVDASAAELRRIERDLHDGAQARLVALTMNLGMAEDLLDQDPQAAKALIADARQGAHTALTELRDLVRGIHPPLLADRGIEGALRSLAMSSAVPVDLDIRLDRRLAPPLESAAYFTMVEAMTNAVKHSGASRIIITVRDLGDRLVLRVEDDGRGGADPRRGSGLRGVERRLAAFDGTLRVTSPVGGPTIVEAELPCVS
ncbi:histidine kinase [Thermopolyspora flexuosa]|uniref:histidine kinase n=2 Tax=Thermopolyspora flexuosa TaxID=103836 RepID=A0A543J4J9_9ACTN|nr:histidine kinase [Thermopolyspora flexuosa]TQM77765.1 putative sensor protein [Thermopolyspora flexuosa]GGM70852.1 histidine kinase [Thermopolyspora flexuosa]